MNKQVRREFLQQQPIPQPTAGGIVLGQQPTKEQMQQAMQAQIDQRLMLVSQAIFNQVVAQWLTTQDTHQQLTHEKMTWLAEQCRAVSPYVLHSFGALQMTETLPHENMDREAPSADPADPDFSRE